MKITICGGGNLGHVCGGFLSSQPGNSVSLLTTRPEAWSEQIAIIDCNGKVFQGKFKCISANPQDVIPEADLILFCLPGFAIREVLQSVVPYLDSSTWVGTVVSSTGFFFEAMKILPATQALFGFQRVPFISRITKYGQEAELKGYKDSLSLAVEQTDEKENIRHTLEQLFKTPVRLLRSHYEVSLSNSNPLLHTSRLYTLWHDWKPGMIYHRNPGFYSEWTQEASEIYIAMDRELQQLLSKLGVEAGAIPTVLDYYESGDAASLAHKISTIPAFQGISSPMILNSSGQYEPDFHSRYFAEDFPYGLRYIHDLAHSKGVDCPNIDVVYEWGMSLIG